MAWSAENIPDLKGKVCIVTGANSGLGYHTTLELARRHARVVMACRNEEKAEEARQSILQEAPSAQLDIFPLDLASFESIRIFATAFTERFERLNVLINNAGIGGFPFGKTKDGFEAQFGVNHLGHFLLTGLLLPVIEATENARVVTVSSIMQAVGKHDFSDINYERKTYNKWHAYGRSKLANALFANELDRRFRKNEVPAISVGVHPGYSSTSFQGKGPKMSGSAIGEVAMKVSNALFAQPDHMGALPTLYAATGADILGGDYIGPAMLWLRGAPEKQKAIPAAYDQVMAKKLWKLSEELTGLSYL